MQEHRTMTAANVRKLLELTAYELHQLHGAYDTLRRITTEPTTREFAGFLARRELETIKAIERYLARDAHDAALDVHVRLGGGFPFAATQEWPEGPDPDRLIEVARRSDVQLDQLCERIELYAAGAQLRETLDALREMVAERRQRLNAATRELNEHAAA